MRKLYSLWVCALLLMRASTLFGQAQELNIVAIDSAKNISAAEGKALVSAYKHYDQTIRSELQSCGAPVQSEPYILNLGSQLIERTTKGHVALVTVRISVPSEKHDQIWGMETDSLPPQQQQTVLRCLRNPPSVATQ